MIIPPHPDDAPEFDLYLTLAQVARDARIKAGLSAKDVADKLRMAEDDILLGESGERKLLIVDLFRYCHVCGLAHDKANRLWMEKLQRKSMMRAHMLKRRWEAQQEAKRREADEGGERDGP